ncbi:iron-sulfur-binding protein [Novosphingobium endophyticum]|uniref:Iron-sulfur-binding protein n=2 Tax=Novosphingobium endophyticum TaxID=1955250 RepID=A0A916X6U4_9SPHN|nr:iron-sulfur-binding protein [Novosphingobium endophyticum]
MYPPTGVYWIETASPAAFPRLAGDISVDVAVIGGGLVGAIAARLIKDQGLRVALVEARSVGQEVTGKSTAKITSQHNLVYTRLRNRFGMDGARSYAEANEAGLRKILALAADHQLAADIEIKAAYTYTLLEEHVGSIEEEVQLARELGLPATLAMETGLPFAARAAMRWIDQAQFHPVKFVAGLAATLPGEGSHVFEQSRVLDWDSSRVVTAKGAIKAGHVVMATQLPLGQTGAYYARNYPHMHPVIAGQADPGRVPEGMYISVEQPRHSLRSHRTADGRPFLIFTGPSYKPGHADEARKAFAEIEGFARDHFGVQASYRWTNEDYTPMDGRPFIGWSSRQDGLLVATGFDAWGISNGAAAAMIICDLLTGRENPWADFFDARRLDVAHGAKQFVKGNAAVAAELVGGHLASTPRDAEALSPGEGAVLKINGEKMAVFRDETGQLHSLAAACSHLGCLLGWNEFDRTWDCPCHGSRFGLDGEVIHGPATEPLKTGVTG